MKANARNAGADTPASGEMRTTVSGAVRKAHRAVRDASAVCAVRSTAAFAQVMESKTATTG